MSILTSPMMRMRAFYASLLAVILTALTTANASAATFMMPAKECYPVNNLLSGPFAGPLTSLTGAVGGLLQTLGLLIIVFLALMAIVTVLTRKSEGFIRSIFLVVGILLGLPLVLAIYTVVQGVFRNLC